MTRTVLKISGADRVSFLQGLVSNDVERIEHGLVYAALLSPQGKYLADFFMLPLEDGIGVDVASSLADGLAQRLTMYRLRADVQIARTGVVVSSGTGPAPAGALADPRAPEMGWRAYGDSVRSDDTDWDALRVAHMIPESGIELIPNESFLLEMNFEALNGVDFRKGCYVGQEVTARMKHKTELRKGLARVSVAGKVPVGTEITVQDKPAGTLFTQSGTEALAYLRFDRATGAMQAAGVTVTRDI